MSSVLVKRLVQCQVHSAHSVMVDFRKFNLTCESEDHLAHFLYLSYDLLSMETIHKTLLTINPRMRQ